MREVEKFSKNSNQNLQDRVLLHYTGILDDEIIPTVIDRLTNDDWSLIIQKAKAHGVAPLIYDRIFDECCVPDDIAQKFRLAYLYCSFSNTRQHHELSMMLTKFKTEGINVIVLKGLAVAGLFYENIAFRPMIDIDLLVKSEDVSRIDKMLSELGWQNCSQRLTGDIQYEKNLVFIDLNSMIHDLPKLNPWISASFVKLDELNIPPLGLDDL
ncbi:MAG: nucleotidyltransferase family protein, partial [Candidatus Poribacteria bacterium]